MSSTSTTYSLCVDNHFSLERCVLISELGLYKADYLIIWTRRLSISAFVGPQQISIAGFINVKRKVCKVFSHLTSKKLKGLVDIFRKYCCFLYRIESGCLCFIAFFFPEML